MRETFTFQTIARIRSDFPEKFGIPRQSGILKELKSAIVFEPEFRNAESLRGLEDFSHLWLLWIFSENIRGKFSPTVRPPRLGGNRRMGVFATRSSFRPNPVALSLVKLERVETSSDGPRIIVSGADLMDGSPIVDIKPYLPFADAVPEATGGFTDGLSSEPLSLEFPQTELEKVDFEKRESLLKILADDPRPAYQKNPVRVYGFRFASYEIKFKVDGGRLFVLSVEGKND